MATTRGGCLCGAVRFEAEISNPSITACHCAMCRRWSGGPLLGVHVDGAVAFRGEDQIGVYHASSWGERGFCTKCGSTLFWRLQDGSSVVLTAGALDDQSGLDFAMEIFVDEQPDYYRFAGERKRMTAEETIAAFAPGADKV